MHATSADNDAHLGETLAELPGLVEALTGSGGTFIEVGAGYGVRLRRLIDAGAMSRFDRTILCDLSELRLQRARDYVPEATAFVADAQQLPIDEATCDFLFSDQVIEHVTSDRAMALEIRRVLRDGGLAYVGSVIKRPGAWYFYRNGGQWRLDPTHVREYPSLDAYRSVFTDAGFTVVQSWTAPMAFPVGEALLRMLVLARIIRTDAYYDVHGGSRILRALSRGRLRIPGYDGCWVLVRK